MIEPSEIRETVRGILVDEFELEPAVVVPDANLQQELQLDSLDGVDLLVALEEKFGVKLDNTFLSRVWTVGELQEHLIAVLTPIPGNRVGEG